VDTTRSARLVRDVIRHAVNGNVEEATRLLYVITQVSDNKQVYGVCCGAADAARQSLVRLFGHPSPEGLWAMAAPDPAHEVRHPAHTFALRFITAYTNEDLETCRALYRAAAGAGAECYVHSVTALFGVTAHLARLALEGLPADVDLPAVHPH
jgi:hypothetical protein